MCTFLRKSLLRSRAPPLTERKIGGPFTKPFHLLWVKGGITVLVDIRSQFGNHLLWGPAWRVGGKRACPGGDAYRSTRGTLVGQLPGSLYTHFHQISRSPTEEAVKVLYDFLSPTASSGGDLMTLSRDK